VDDPILNAAPVGNDQSPGDLSPMNGHSRYVLIETLISVAINILISALFMFLVFGSMRSIELWGVHGLALDFVPQTFMITLMSVLVPSWLTRRRMRSGRITMLVKRARGRPPRNIFVRAVVIGVVLTVLLGGCALLVTAELWRVPEPFWHVLPFKLAYGALVAAIATPLGLRATLSEV
jgi:hypothetical protein